MEAWAWAAENANSKNNRKWDNVLTAASQQIRECVAQSLTSHVLLSTATSADWTGMAAEWHISSPDTWQLMSPLLH